MNPHYSEHPGYATFTLAQPFTVNLLTFQSYTVCNDNGCQAALNANGPTICHSQLLTRCCKVGQVPASNPC